MNTNSKRRNLTLLTKTGEPTFAKLPMVLISDVTLNSNAKVLWAYLKHRQGDNDFAWPSQERISEDTGISRSTISRATRDLVDAGWLIVWPMYLGNRSNNCYRTNIPEHAETRMKQRTNSVSPVYESESIDVSIQVNDLCQFDAVIDPVIKPEIQPRESRFALDFEKVFQRV